MGSVWERRNPMDMSKYQPRNLTGFKYTVNLMILISKLLYFLAIQNPKDLLQTHLRIWNHHNKKVMNLIQSSYGSRKRVVQWPSIESGRNLRSRYLLAFRWMEYFSYDNGLLGLIILFGSTLDNQYDWGLCIESCKFGPENPNNIEAFYRKTTGINKSLWIYIPRASFY